MPKIDGVRERRHQPFYDHLVKGIGISSVGQKSSLFGNANVGNRQLTNLQIPGVLASDQTFVIKALRVQMLFQSLNDAEFGTFGPLPDLAASASGTNSRAQDLYSLLAYSGLFELVVGDKPQFLAPLWYAPSGGGVYGFSSENSRHVLTNGVPTHQSILKLAKDIHVPARQNFKVDIEIFPFNRLGAGQNAAFAADLNTIDYLNQFDGIKEVSFHLDGVQTRDVQ